MTDHSTARALAPCPWCAGTNIDRDEGQMFCVDCEAVGPRISFGEPLDREERWNTRTLTPPEGDTLSDEVEDLELRIAAREAEIEALMKRNAALQSRVSPQEGLREALVDASRWFRDREQSLRSRYEQTGCEVNLRRSLEAEVAELGELLAKIDAALSASRKEHPPVVKQEKDGE